jgi:hypothetical protein
MNLQELQKNGQLVDKMFAFCLINPDEKDKKIYDISGFPTNMTMLGAHFKISSNGKNPFEKQKQWENPRRTKQSFATPLFIFLLQ